MQPEHSPSVKWSEAPDRMLRNFVSYLMFVIIGLSSTSTVFPQEITFENELPDFRLYGVGKMQNLFLKSSTKADVTSVFGKDCAWTFCEYDENWQVMFVYLEPFMSEYEFIGEKELKLIPFPQFYDRLWLIRFRPRSSIKMDPSVFSSEFKQETDTMIHSGVPILVFRDGKGLLYVLNDSDEFRWRLLSIEYYVPKRAKADVFFPVQIRTRVPMTTP